MYYYMTVETYTVIICQQSYFGPTIIWYSITHSLFHSRFKPPFLQILPTAAVPFSPSGFTTRIPQIVYCYFSAYQFLLFSFFLVLHFLVVGSVR